MKTSGFNIEDSHLTDVDRIEKLFALVLVAFTWVYIASIYLDSLSPVKIKSHGRKAKSLFNYGLTYIANLLYNNDINVIAMKPYYWTSGNKAEIDFLIQIASQIIPAEVKSEKRVSGKSLSAYNKKFSPENRIRFSLNNLHHENGLITIPVFLTDCSKRIIELKTLVKPGYIL